MEEKKNKMVDFETIRDEIIQIQKERNQIIIDEHLAQRPAKNIGTTDKGPEMDTEQMKLRKQKEEMERAAIEKEKSTVSFMKTK